MSSKKLVRDNVETSLRPKPIGKYPGSHSDRYETCYILREPQISAVLWLMVLLTL